MSDVGNTASQSRKRKKAYYRKCAAKHSRRQPHVLRPQMRGVLVTCNKRERETVIEVYELLKEADLALNEQVAPVAEKTVEDEPDEDDIQAALRREMTEAQAPPLFRQFPTDVSNCLFIHSNSTHSPDALVSFIFQRALTTGERHSRYTARLIPILATCRAELDSIRDTLTQLCTEFFAKRSSTDEQSQLKTFSVIFKSRNYNKLQRENVTQMVGSVVQSAAPQMVMDYDSPDLVVAVNLLRTTACLSLLEHFSKYRKYNLQEVGQPIGHASEKQAASS